MQERIPTEIHEALGGFTSGIGCLLLLYGMKCDLRWPITDKEKKFTDSIVRAFTLKYIMRYIPFQESSLPGCYTTLQVIELQTWHFTSMLFCSPFRYLVQEHNKTTPANLQTSARACLQGEMVTQQAGYTSKWVTLAYPHFFLFSLSCLPDS